MNYSRMAVLMNCHDKSLSFFDIMEKIDLTIRIHVDHKRQLHPYILMGEYFSLLSYELQ